MDRSTELQSVRELRKIAILGDTSARLTLCRLYAAGKFGGCSRQAAVAYVREFVQSSAVLNVRAVYSGTELTHSMRSVNVRHYNLSLLLDQQALCRSGAVSKWVSI